MLRWLSGIYTVIMVFKSSNSIGLYPDEYGSLILNAYNRYSTSGILITASIDYDSLEHMSFMYIVSRDLSDKGIINIVVNFSLLEKRIKFYHQRIGRPLVVIIITSERQILEFENRTKTMIMNYPFWMMIFSSNTDDNLCKFCRNPNSNVFRLKYDSQFFVSCCNITNLEEWWSQEGNKTSVLPLGELVKNKMNWQHHQTMYIQRRNLGRRSLRIIVQEPDRNSFTDRSQFEGEVFAELMYFMNSDIPNGVAAVSSCTFSNSTQEWSGIIGDLNKNNYDIAASLFPMMPQHLNIIEFSVSFYSTSSWLYFKKPEGAYIRWTAYFKAFEIEVWVTILGIIIMSSILLTVFKLGLHEKSLWSVTSENYLYIWGIFCQQGLLGFPREKPQRIAYLTIFFTALMVSAAYTGSIISFLTTSKLILPFNSMEEFSEQTDYKLMTLGNTQDYDLFAESNDTVLKKIFNHAMLPKNIQPLSEAEATRRLCSEMVAYYTYIVMDEIRALKLPCHIVQINTARSKNFAMMLPRYSQYSSIINYHMYRLRECGIWKRLLKKYFKKELPEADSYAPVTGRDIASVFIILGGGIVLALLILICERIRFTIVYYYSSKISHSKPRKRNISSAIVAKNLFTIREKV